MRSWASALALVLCAQACAEGLSVQATPAAPGRTRLQAGSASLVVTRDDQVPPAAAPAGAQVVASIGRTVLVVVDRYPSRLNRGAGECGAGEERFLRVIRLVPAPAHETYKLKLASCWTDLMPDDEFGDHGLQWTAATGELRIEWVAGPDSGTKQSLVLQIAPDGQVRTTKPA